MVLSDLIRKPWLKWVLMLLCWTVIGLAFASQLYLSRSKLGIPVTWGVALGPMADWYVYGLLSIPALWVARHFPIGRAGWSRTLAVHLGASVLFSLTWMVLRAAIEHWQTAGDVYPMSFQMALRYSLGVTYLFNPLVYFGVVFAQHAADYYWKFHERELHTAELETRLTEARLQALQMQLNPHFLFNTLNAISSLMHRDVDAADRMIVRLSELLRYTLESTEAQEVPLRQELAFLDRYLEIQQARFGDRLEVRHEIDPGALEAQVPNLVLQPLLENALEHGVAPHVRHGCVVLRARRRDERLQLEVQDNGAGIRENHPLVDGVGLANTRARLQQLYGAAQTLELRNVPGGGLVVQVSIPWRPGPDGQQSAAPA